MCSYLYILFIYRKKESNLLFLRFSRQDCCDVCVCVCMRKNLTTCVIHHETMCHFPFHILILHFFSFHSFVRTQSSFPPSIQLRTFHIFFTTGSKRKHFLREQTQFYFIHFCFFFSLFKFPLCRFLMTFFHPLFLASFISIVISHRIYLGS